MTFRQSMEIYSDFLYIIKRHHTFHIKLKFNSGEKKKYITEFKTHFYQVPIINDNETFLCIVLYTFILFILRTSNRILNRNRKKAVVRNTFEFLFTALCIINRIYLHRVQCKHFVEFKNSQYSAESMF